MIEIVTKCDDCVHKPVCSLETEFAEKIEEERRMETADDWLHRTLQLECCWFKNVSEISDAMAHIARTKADSVK